MTKKELEDKIKVLEQKLEQANKTIDEISSFNVEQEPIVKKVTLWERIKRYFEPVRIFREWDIYANGTIISPCKQYIYYLDNSQLRRSIDSKKILFEGTYSNMREYYNKVMNEIKYREKETFG